jgi:hypothetical protein
MPGTNGWMGCGCCAVLVSYDCRVTLLDCLPGQGRLRAQRSTSPGIAHRSSAYATLRINLAERHLGLLFSDLQRFIGLVQVSFALSPQQYQSVFLLNY